MTTTIVKTSPAQFRLQTVQTLPVLPPCLSSQLIKKSTKDLAITPNNNSG